MGMLQEQYQRADFGNENGYGFIDFEDALNSIDIDDAPLGRTFKISGAIYQLIGDKQNIKFRLVV